MPAHLLETLLVGASFAFETCEEVGGVDDVEGGLVGCAVVGDGFAGAGELVGEAGEGGVDVG